MFFRFRPTPGGILSAPPSNSASASVIMKASFACLGACSKSYFQKPSRLNAAWKPTIFIAPGSK